MTAIPTAPDPKAAALQLLRERYRQTITRTVEAFRQLAAQLAATPAAPEILETLRRELHRVRGSAGSYGYVEASRLAEQLEHRAVRWAGDPTLESEQRTHIIAHFASALELAFKLGEAAGDEERSQRTFLLVEPAEHLLAPARTEAQLRGFRVVTLTADQCTLPVLQDIGPHVIGVMPAHVEQVGAIVWPRGIPMVVLEDRPLAKREGTMSAIGGQVGLADVHDGIGAAFDVAERLLVRRSGVGSTVLAVDDDPSILAMVRYFLEGPQIQVVTLEDPAKLSEAIEAVRPALLLMDIQMPGYNGIELARAIRSSPRTSDLPIVLLSGEIDPESRGRAHEAGADEFISKPIAPAQLRARIGAQLERQRLARLSAGLHPATGLLLPERMHRAADSVLTQHRLAGSEVTVALLRPVHGEGGEEETAAWLRETRRLGVALESRALVVGYFEGTSLAVVMPGDTANAGDAIRGLDGARPADAPEWRAGVVSSTDLPGDDAAGLLRAAEEAVDVAVRSAGSPVHRWLREEALIAPDVILVEDDPALSEMLQYALRATGFSYRAFGNGRLALDALMQLRTHGRRPFVLLDIDLPGMDGYSLHERLRVERPGEFSYVYITAHAAEPDQLRALRSGAVDFIAKPINLRILMAKMSSWVESMGRSA